MSYQPGERVAVEWGGVWWPARVVRAAGPDRWLINYADWDTAWNEEVGRSRIRRRSASLGGVRVWKGAPVFAAAVAAGGLVLAGSVAFLVLGQHRSAATAEAAPDYAVGATYQQGEAVRVWWESGWYDGHIVSVQGDGKYEISYDGWSDSWNETVTNQRLKKKPRTGMSAATRATANATSTTAASTAAPSDTAGQPQAPRRAYHKGQAVMIKWGRRWWPGRIRAVAGKDRYLIHYDGYSASWDETVGPPRLKPR